MPQTSPPRRPSPILRMGKPTRNARGSARNVGQGVCRVSNGSHSPNGSTAAGVAHRIGEKAGRAGGEGASSRPESDPAQRGAAPLSSEAKRRVRLAENQRKGFESAWNEYFDCYASTTYAEEPLIRLEDVSYHLYLKKHINPTNPRWELPSFRQLKKILGLSQDKLQGIEARLATARLLVKDSGKGKGAKGENVANDYLL